MQGQLICIIIHHDNNIKVKFLKNSLSIKFKILRFFPIKKIKNKKISHIFDYGARN